MTSVAQQALSNLRATVQEFENGARALEALSAAGIAIDQVPMLGAIAREAAKLNLPTSAPAAKVAGQRIVLSNDIFTDNQTNLIWTTKTYEIDSVEHAEKLAVACRDGGFTDWQVPEDSQLITLRDTTQCNPATLPELRTITRTDYAYRTRTPHLANKTSLVWGVSFYSGYVGYCGYPIRLRLLPVRSRRRCGPRSVILGF